MEASGVDAKLHTETRLQDQHLIYYQMGLLKLYTERGLIFFSIFLGRKRLPLLICFLIVSLYIALSLLYNISWLLINLNEIR